ncbi:MAG TPA: phospholipase A [Ramlibacter sp.]|uniref:phospholipase A n=1 Tax=Ramlibacter sp. TaxID=1917967 RepID=UPI002D3BD529|nr:phospholipase A [Ramlibacter sp.]HZY16901.1 phospholipase A [Ramlibacter sp.]
MTSASFRSRFAPRRLAWLSALAPASFAGLAAPAAAQEPAWQACAAQAAPAARLACYDAWARRQPPAAAPVSPVTPAWTVPGAAAQPASPASPAAAPAAAAGTTPPPEPPPVGLELPAQAAGPGAPTARCGTAKSELARTWDLETATGCGVLGIRLYRPLQLGLVTADTVNRQPTSDNPANQVGFQPYRNTETRIQLSVRTKIAEGLLTERGPLRDSLWFAYTQQSYWQLFTPALSRPFRSTDHEPEVIYIHPFAVPAVRGWTLRYGGLGLVHQSNGQSLPRSRSWNRVYLMAGADTAAGTTLQARLWRRLREDGASDDNPGISDYIGRAELVAGWRTDTGRTLSLTLRNTLRDQSRGSAKVEWMMPVDSAEQPGEFGRLRLHASLFSGYGDTLLDYNRRRTVFSVGVSLVDW